MESTKEMNDRNSEWVIIAVLAFLIAAIAADFVFSPNLSINPPQ